MTVKEERLEDLVLDESNANAGTERGRGLEIDPNYVSVALERLEGMGLTPHRIEGGTHEQVG